MMFGLTRTSTHRRLMDEALAGANETIEALTKQLDAANAKASHIHDDFHDANEAYKREYERANRIAGRLSAANEALAAANAELAEFRAKRQRANANLRNYKPAAVPATN